jgi:GntR family transcriptional regulator/MocR family aminotransferase
MIERFAAARFVSDRFSPTLDQAILCDFISEGHLARHVRRMRSLYEERLDAFTAAVRRQLQGLLSITKHEAGLETVGWLVDLSAEDAAAAAAEHQIEIVPLSRFAIKSRVENGLLLGFAACDSAELTRGVDRLARVLEELVSRLQHDAPPTGQCANRGMARRWRRPSER